MKGLEHQIMDKKKDKLEFNTYCIFTKDKPNIEETIGFIFKDYIENRKNKNK